ncbi:MAG: DNA repair protein RadC [Planctomycetota bacterium]
MQEDAKRRERLQQVILPLLQLDEFDKQTAQSTCHEAARGYVTSTINDLIRDDWLCRVDVAGQPRFRWTRRRDAFEPDKWINGIIFGQQVTQTPVTERPRERLLRDGPESLTLGDLLAILIRAGIKGESAISGGSKLASRFDERLPALASASIAELREITKAVNIANYAQIMAGIELGRRVEIEARQDGDLATKITSTAAAVEYCRRRFGRLASDRSQEEFHIVTLDTKHKPIADHRVTVGTLDASLVHPREVFRPAIRDAASAVLLVHNHPSGDPTPSREDVQVTERLTDAGKLIGIQVLDHIIVARQRCLSLREET